MNAYVKTVLIALAAVAASAAVAARPAEPDAIILPAPVVATLLQYLNNRPYQDVAGLMGGLQRCLQDQVPDDKGTVAERGNCPEIAVPLRQIKIPLSRAMPRVDMPVPAPPKAP